ncbi:MAG: type IV toxin-antitoxin system AbiEi family antitoxin domain-containing protein [Solirubrobacterales bacterium]
MPSDGREKPARRASGDHRPRWGALQAFAAGRHWVVAIAELIGLGFSRSAIDRLVRAGYLHPLHQGVYAVGHPDASVTGRRLAAVLACGRDAVLSDRSAAAHLGLRESSATVIDVTIQRRSSLKHPGIRIHRRLTLINEDTVVVDAVPCTSMARTLLDLSSFNDDRATERALERAEVLRIYDHRAIESLLARAAGQPGSRRLARVAGIARPGRTTTASDLEEAMLALCRRCGYPDPIVNHEMLLGGERARVDFFWPVQRVVVEVDGFNYHRTRAAFRRDRRRDRLLELEGYGHARFADADFDHDLVAIERQLGALLGRR